MRHGVENGNGVYRTSQGDYYEGEWIDGLLHGRGMYVLADRSSYSGMFVEGVEHGHGTHNDADGGVYVGEFLFGARADGVPLRPEGGGGGSGDGTHARDTDIVVNVTIDDDDDDDDDDNDSNVHVSGGGRRAREPRIIPVNVFDELREPSEVADDPFSRPAQPPYRPGASRARPEDEVLARSTRVVHHPPWSAHEEQSPHKWNPRAHDAGTPADHGSSFEHDPADRTPRRLFPDDHLSVANERTAPTSRRSSHSDNDNDNEGGGGGRGSSSARDLPEVARILNSSSDGRGGSSPRKDAGKKKNKSPARPEWK
jgi:hypothetical protein